MGQNKRTTAQLKVYMPKDKAQSIKEQAAKAGISVSAYVQSKLNPRKP